ncbi:MAG TPA: RNA chaperone Hfq [Candidatus Polarisedimenticolia bacterium]|nr:RNA chaperone Hfq [Candidatus Polarisedimenticolia bacterium]
MDRDNSLNIQNDFFNQARKDKARVLVFLNSGKKLTGRIKSFDKFTVILESGQGEQMIFKHAIATVTSSRTFGNFINSEGAAEKGKEGPRVEGPEKPAEGEGSDGAGAD